MIQPVKVLLICCCLCFAYFAAAQRPEPIALIHANVIDVEKGISLPDQVITIRDGRITAIFPYSKRAKLSGYTLIDANHRYLIPGLIDSHLHLHWLLLSGSSRKDLPHAFKLMLANGITGFREAGGSGFQRQLVAMRDSINNGYITAPRMYVSGYTNPKNLARFKVSSYTALVDSFTRIGVDGIKIKSVTSKETKEIIDAARANHLQVYGHTSEMGRNETTNILGDFTMDAISYGLAGVMHSMGYVPLGNNKVPQGPEPVYKPTSPLWDKWWIYADNLWLYADPLAEQTLIQAMIAKDVWLEPTFSIESTLWRYSELPKKDALVYLFAPDSTYTVGFPRPTGSTLDSARLVFSRKQLFLKRFYDAGGIVLAGTDGLLYGDDLRDELRFMVQAGLPPAAALKAATYNNAKALGWQQDLGTIAPGKIANMVLLSDNPLENINHLERIEAIFMNGNYYDRSILSDWLQDVKEAARKYKKQKL